MAKPRVKIESRFPAVKKAAHELANHARDVWKDVGEDTAEKYLERIDDTRGYELPIDIQSERVGFQSARFFYDPFYGRWFEYGTVRLPASPFMRPASRKARKAYVALMADDFEGWIRQRAGMRR